MAGYLTPTPKSHAHAHAPQASLTAWLPASPASSHQQHQQQSSDTRQTEFPIQSSRSHESYFPLSKIESLDCLVSMSVTVNLTEASNARDLRISRLGLGVSHNTPSKPTPSLSKFFCSRQSFETAGPFRCLLLPRPDCQSVRQTGRFSNENQQSQSPSTFGLTANSVDSRALGIFLLPFNQPTHP